MTSWSYSSYSTAVQCLRKYKLIYIDRLVSEVKESGDLAFGSALHSAINAVLTKQDALAIFNIYWDSYQNKEIEYGRYNWTELKELATRFITNFEKRHAKKYELVFAEERLYAEYKGLKLDGQLDFYGLYNGRRSLRDFKTSGRNYEEAKGDTSLQLSLYAFLYLSNNPDSTIDTLGYTVFNKGTGSIQDLTWDFDEKVMYEALDHLVDYCQMIGKGNHEYPKNFNACLDYNRKCQFFDVCHKKENKND